MMQRTRGGGKEGGGRKGEGEGSNHAFLATARCSFLANVGGVGWSQKDYRTTNCHQIWLIGRKHKPAGRARARVFFGGAQLLCLFGVV